MKRYVLSLTAVMGLMLCGCGNATGNEVFGTQNGYSVEAEPTAEQNRNTVEAGLSQLQNGNIIGDKMPQVQTGNTSAAANEGGAETSGMSAVQGGPYGEISVTLPAGWSYEVCPMDSDKLMYGLYGIHFYPEGISDGYVELAYTEFFGVCGMGLKEEQAAIAGNTVYIGTFDDHNYWDFISFEGEYKGIVALTYWVDTWWDEYGGQVINILDTLVFDQSIRESSTYVYSSDSEINEIGLHFSLENISATGATIVLSQFDADAPKGELICGEDFVIEQYKEGEWVSAPIIVEGNYGFHDIALMIPIGDKREDDISWEWLYGELAPGEYRIGKSILDVTGSGSHDKYMIYAQFILN